MGASLVERVLSERERQVKYIYPTPPVSLATPGLAKPTASGHKSSANRQDVGWPPHLRARGWLFIWQINSPDTLSAPSSQAGGQLSPKYTVRARVCARAGSRPAERAGDRAHGLRATAIVRSQEGRCAECNCATYPVSI